VRLYILIVRPYL